MPDAYVVDTASTAEMQAARAEMVRRGLSDTVNQYDAAISASSGGGFFGGLFDSIASFAKMNLNIVTFGNADPIVHAGQQVARNKYVQAAALGYATIATGGALGAAMGGGAVGVGAGTAVASGAISKVSGQGFNLKKVAMAGLTAGLGAGGEVAQNIKAGINTVQAVQGANKAYQNYQNTKKQGAQLAAANAELASLNAQLAAEQATAAQLAAMPAQAAPITATAAAKTAQPQPAGDHFGALVAGGAAALKLLALA